MDHLAAPDRARFESFVDRSNSSGCHLWQGGTSRGYGSFWLGGRLHRAHRVAYQAAHGPIADGCVVRHRCDNPSCVNVEHLHLGTLLLLPSAALLVAANDEQRNFSSLVVMALAGAWSCGALTLFLFGMKKLVMP